MTTPDPQDWSPRLALWKKEHGPDYEVPGVIDFMVKQGVLTDMSWHNDVCPSFGVDDHKNSQRGVRLWVDHPITFERETGNKRFAITKGEYGSEHEFELETDDLVEALETLVKQAKPYFPPDREPDVQGLIEEWKHSVRRRM